MERLVAFQSRPKGIWLNCNFYSERAENCHRSRSELLASSGPSRGNDRTHADPGIQTIELVQIDGKNAIDFAMVLGMKSNTGGAT